MAYVRGQFKYKSDFLCNFYKSQIIFKKKDLFYIYSPCTSIHHHNWSGICSFETKFVVAHSAIVAQKV